MTSEEPVMKIEEWSEHIEQGAGEWAEHKKTLKMLIVEYVSVLLNICRNFIYKDLPQVQFKNRLTQFLTVRNRTPIPVVDIFYGTLM